jgi:hypothetical protein
MCRQRVFGQVQISDLGSTDGQLGVVDAYRWSGNHFWATDAFEKFQ